MTIPSEKFTPLERLFIDIVTDVMYYTKSGAVSLNISTIIDSNPSRYKDLSYLSKHDSALADRADKCLSDLSTIMERCFVEMPLSSKIPKAIFLLKSITLDLSKSQLLRSAAYKFAAYTKIAS